MTAHVASASGAGRVTLIPGVGVQLEVREADAWRVVSVPGPLVSGLHFELVPQSVDVIGDALTLAGASAAGVWTGSVSAVPGSDWVRFVVDLASVGIDLDGVEPEIRLDLGALPPYERGNHFWFKTIVENPPQWNHEGRGNGFPALYYYDPAGKAEYSMFFDLTAMSWMSRTAGARFLDYRCGVRRRFDELPALELGLLTSGRGGSALPAGPTRFEWYVSVAHRDDVPMPPTEQEALIALVDACLTLLRPSGERWPEHSLSWTELADGLATDLMNDEHAWRTSDGEEHLLAYVDGRSEAWVGALEARGKQFLGLGPCLDSALWLLRPLDAAIARFPQSPWGGLRDRVDALAQRELLRADSVLLGGPTAAPQEMGTWQYVYMLADAWSIYSARGIAAITDRIRSEVDAVLLPFAHAVQYVFPLSFDKSTLRKYGPGANVGTAGTYAMFMLELARTTGERHYVLEAQNALLALANVPIDDALQEVFFSAHALDAADELFALTGDEQWRGLRHYFRAQAIRMMYWYDDRTSPALATVDHLGMFEACLGINYPALFENLEMDARLAASLPFDRAPEATLRVLDYGRRNNASFYPAVNPDVFGPMPLAFVPYEELPLLDGSIDAGFLGQEIYGSGWTFRAWLLWEAFATAADREVMIVNTDSYHERADRLGFVVYNGTTVERTTTIEFMVDVASVSVDGGQPVATQSVEVTLAAGGWRRLDVVVTA